LSNRGTSANLKVTKPSDEQKEPRMDVHKNARTLRASRELLVVRVHSGWKVKTAAEAAGISERRTYEWLRRGREQDPSTLFDRSSRPDSSPKRISQTETDEIVRLRRQRLTYREIGQQVGRSLSVISRVLTAAGISRLHQLEGPLPPPKSYECIRPGALVHLDIKALGCIKNGLRQPDASGRRHAKRPRSGWEYLHVAIDDHSRLSYAEVLTDQASSSAAAFVSRTVQWYAERGIVVERVMTDNGGCYISRAFKAACEAHNVRHRRTRPYTPRTNGKAERLIQTLSREWAHRFSYTSSTHRTEVLPRYLHFYNYHRAHTALSGAPPVSRVNLNNLSELHNW
jgi:transposase InsO family protein